MIRIPDTHITNGVSVSMGAFVPAGWTAPVRAGIAAGQRELEHRGAVSYESPIAPEALRSRVRIRNSRFDRSRALVITDDKRRSTTTQLSR